MDGGSLSEPERQSFQNSILSISGIVKHFGGVQALRGVSFDIKRGEVLGCLGPTARERVPF